MKHRKTGRQFGRVRAQRTALMRTMVGSLLLHDRIETTEAKAKELRRVVDRVITRARRAAGAQNDKMMVVRALEADVPRAAIVRLRDEILPRIGKRVSGFTRVVKLSPRKSDGASMAIIAFVDQPQPAAPAKTHNTEKTPKKTPEKKAA